MREQEGEVGKYYHKGYKVNNSQTSIWRSLLNFFINSRNDTHFPAYGFMYIN